MKNLILIFVLIAMTISCDRNNTENAYNPQLPPVSTTGANTFGAIINGKVMIPRNSIDYYPPGSNQYPVIYSSTSNFESIGASDRRDTRRGDLFIYIENLAQQSPLTEGEYAIQDGNGSFENDLADGIMITCSLYINNQLTIYKSIANTGKITITKSNTNVFSGTFSCKAVNKNNPNDIIEITNGRFDFNKSTINTTNFP